MKRRTFLQTVPVAALLGRARLRSQISTRPTDPAPHVSPDLLTQTWSARWIAVPGSSAFDYGVHHFRRTFDLAVEPLSFVVHVSADNRYQLFVNGERVVWGPARSDLNRWRFETVDIARHLRAGRNVVAALVWNFGEYAPEAQVTHRTAFILQGNSESERVIDTNDKWKCMRNPAYWPLHYSHAQMRGYFVAGPADSVDGAQYPWGWADPALDDGMWAAGESDPRWSGAPREVIDAPNRWLLVPRTLPLMEETPQRLAAVRLASGTTVPSSFPREPSSFTVPPNTRARLLLDQSHLTTAYPELVVSGGTAAVIRLGYAESLFADPSKGVAKGNRNDVEGKTFVGYYDTFTSDGGVRRLYRPLWWRTYRYIDLDIQTKTEPLTVEDLRGVYTGYPFQMKARFEGSDRLSKMLEIGWRTARLCAHETYMDCPYYEQLQYAGDTRIQALVSYYNAGDARLARNAIAQLNDSRTAEGATMSRAPTRQQQYIPPFSLWWIGMVHDYWRYVNDPEFVREMLPGVRAVLGFFARYQRSNGSLAPLPWWNFVDWAWKNRGIPPMVAGGSSAAIDLQLLLALDWAADLEEALGSKTRAAECRASATALRTTIRQLYWDSSRLLVADTPRKVEYSQHANALAVLARVVDGEDARALVGRTLKDGSLTQCTFYFRHYLHSAVNQVGEGDRYPDLLTAWDDMLARGLTTWAENPEPTRSDCHAWSASPNFEIFRTVLGIDSAAPGFRRVSIRPFLGKLARVSGTIPHPAGEVSVSLALSADGKLSAEVSLPPNVTGEFIWRGQRRELKGGQTEFAV
ncbi:MAG TPA: alpha-L-rhamnosidase C-terminal domain-containing protein [Vicinamibacterales bacterium]|nr:alpha-L-rhamnosidase C-terminal domain-containing protein [Vicinamibacterales bacterium]